MAYMIDAAVYVKCFWLVVAMAGCLYLAAIGIYIDWQLRKLR